MAEIVCGTCGTNDGTHERWCAVGRRITEIAAKDRRIAELEAALGQWETLEQFGSALEISQDLERLWELLEVDGEPYEGEDSLSSLYEHRIARIARLESQIAAKDRRIAELEAALRSLLGCRRSDIVDELHAAADVLNGTPTLDALLAQAKREALEDAADVFAVDPYRPVERALRRMAREVKP